MRSRFNLTTIGSAQHLLLALILLASIPVKLLAAQNMVWDIDIVPVVTLGLDFFAGGAFPVYGTLSSVAAYNMPMLVWLQMPAMLLTHDPWQIMLLTQLAINLVGSIYVYRLGAGLAGPRLGLLAALLFTFSETGISGAYTAWAQLLLPSLFAIVGFYLWRWTSQNSARGLALSGIVAVVAFMTHFGAVLLLPAMFILGLLTRARWHLRALLFGTLLCAALFAPYLTFQAGRDFVDLRAFFSRELRIPPEQMAPFLALRDEGAPAQPVPSQPINAGSTANTEAQAETEADVPAPASAAPNRVERALAFVLGVPGEVLAGLNLAFSYAPRGLSDSPFYLAAQLLQGLILLGFWLGAGLCLWLTWRRWRKGASLALALRQGPEGPLLGLLGMLIVIILGFIATRSGPSAQPSYYAGLISWQMLIAAYGLIQGLAWLRLPERRGNLLLAGLGLCVMLMATGDRIGRLQQHDDSLFSRYNVWLYRHVADASAFIAQDWQQAGDPAISYDIMPQLGNLWWVPAWNLVDDSYRMGAPFDALLRTQHGLENRNQDAIGLSPDADYVIVYPPGLPRYEDSPYAEVGRFGAIVLLKRSEDAS